MAKGVVLKTVYIRESEVFEEMRCGRFDLRANFTQRFNESLRRVMMRRGLVMKPTFGYTCPSELLRPPHEVFRAEEWDFHLEPGWRIRQWAPGEKGAPTSADQPTAAPALAAQAPRPR